MHTCPYFVRVDDRFVVVHPHGVIDERCGDVDLDKQLRDLVGFAQHARHAAKVELLVRRSCRRQLKALGVKDGADHPLQRLISEADLRAKAHVVNLRVYRALAAQLRRKIDATHT